MREVISNHHRRPLLSWAALSPAEQRRYAWIRPEDRPLAQFVRYRRHIYPEWEFRTIRHDQYTPDDLEPWHGRHTQPGVCSDLLLRRLGDQATVIVGRLCLSRPLPAVTD